MLSYTSMSHAQIRQEISLVVNQYNEYAKQKRSLNMTRGKPCSEQLDLSSGLLTCLAEDDYRASDGTDCRNYGGLDGIPEARVLFSELLEFPADQIMVLGNASLNIMYDMLVRAMLFPVPGAAKPWSAEAKIRFICPAPGYDRHFAITERLGIEMITVPMLEDGPDMDQVEALAAADPSIKGMWLVPYYSNPQGYSCSDETCRRLAAMKAAPDFRIFWDNAYLVHHLDLAASSAIPDILQLCSAAGNADRVLAFASTSKITFAGAGIACIAASADNLAYTRKHMAIQTIGPDKINQLRHVRFLKNLANVESLMAMHAAILKPKFDLVDQILRQELAGLNICSWLEPKGGYFISLDVLPGTADQVVGLAKDCGVELTPAGSTYPYGRDPNNSNIRLAPSFPPLAELRSAMEILAVCIRLAALRSLEKEK